MRLSIVPVLIFLAAAPAETMLRRIVACIEAGLVLFRMRVPAGD